jgi:hypothetical protein
MIPIKIQCACGQRYAFEVEAVGGRMPSAVACPACGADGTAAANAAIAQSLAAQPPIAARPVGILLNAPTSTLSAFPAAAASPVPTAAPPPIAAPRRPMPAAGQVDRTRAENEARAKISWGDPPEDVIKFLMMQGFGYEEASILVRALVRERASTIRRNGIGKILIGCVLVPVPIVAFSVFIRMGYIPLTPAALTVMAGLYGAWMLLKGSFMVLAPKSEPGDVADQ